MAIVSIGTPTQTLGTSLTTATSAWGAGQNRTPGNYLLAAVAFACTTAGNISNTSPPAGWNTPVNGIRNNAGTSVTSTVYYAIIATGGDAAPSFPLSNLAGTAATSVTLFEFHGVNSAFSTFPANLIGGADAGGNYASGGVAGTLSPSATTATNVSRPGSYALYQIAMERAAATNTWNPTATWTNVVNNGGTNSIGHFAVDFKLNPPTKATLAASGSWTTETTALGSAQVLVLSPLASPVDTPSAQGDYQGNTCSNSQANLAASTW